MAVNPIKHKATATLQGQLMMARDALKAQQQAMSVVGHNVSNIQTEGYTRQRVVFTPNTGIDGNPGQIGMGARIAEIQRMSNEFVDNQVRYETGSLGHWESQRDGLMMIEEVLSEVESNALSSAMDEYWNAWEDLANDADSITARINLIERAETMARAFQTPAEGIGKIRETMNIDLQTFVSEINDAAARIANLNSQITAAVTRGQSPNDLMDQREQLIQKLSRIIGITVQNDTNGSVSIYIGSDILVARDSVREVYWQDNAEKGKSGGDMAFRDTDSLLNIVDGEAYGKIFVRDEAALTALDDLNLLANTIRDEVNALHETGISLDGTTGNRFWRNDMSGAIDLQVAEDLYLNPEKVATSAVSSTGDSSLAHQIFDLQFNKYFNNGESDISDYYRGTVARVGTLVRHATDQADASVAAVEQAENWRQHYSGVNLDEEMANMIAYQRIYMAAAKVLTQVDEMIRGAMSLGQ